MNSVNVVKNLALAAVVSLSFAANANALPFHVSIHAGASNGHPNFHSRVPAVPEADTWAMMAVGLGLVGLRLRRKSKQSQVG